MMIEFAIRYGDCGGSHDGIDEAICTFGQSAMVNPNMIGTKNGNAIAIALCPKTNMVNRISYHATRGRYDMMNPDVVDYDIMHKLDR